MTECINVYCATQSIARSLLLYVSVCPTVCHVDVSKRPKLLSNFSSHGGPIILVFKKGTRLWNSDGITLNRGAKQRWGTKHLRFSTSISEIPIPNTEEVFQNTDTEYRTDMKKIPTKILNTDTDSKYRYRPSSNMYVCYYDLIYH